MKTAARKTWESMLVALPIIVGVLLLLSLLQPLFERYYARIFTGNWFLDPLIGTVAGSFSFGIPVVSYVTAGELTRQGVPLVAVIAFIFSWTTVGVPMLPLESENLGRRFAIVRNGLNFVFSIVIAVCTVAILKFYGHL